FFSKELLEEWRWSERYPGPAEILCYLNHVAEKFALRRDICFNTRVTAAHYDEAANRWDVVTESGERYRVRYLVTAVGCLSAANIPQIPGLESFAGGLYHTGQWPPEGVDFRGKRVGQIGTGSTGIQAAPVLAETAAHLTGFQRTAQYSVPARNAPLAEEFLQYVREHHDELRQPRRRWRISTTPMPRSAHPSTRTITRLSTATMPRWWTCAPSRSSASPPPASRRAPGSTRWTSSSSPPASTR